MTPVALPAAIEAVFNNFMTCEFTTLGKGGVPIAWPTLPTYWAEQGQFVIASPVALSQKAANVRRDPRVALLFSNPTGSGLVDPPAVLVQGRAHSPDQSLAGTAGLHPQVVAHFARQGRRMLGTQPGLRLYLANPLTRFVMEWYFIRVFIYITPSRLTWWAGGDFERTPQHWEVPHVATDQALPA
jgi:hypothetical protein